MIVPPNRHRKAVLGILLALAVAACVVGLPRAFTWVNYYYLDSSFYIPPGYPPKPLHAASCRNHVTFVWMTLREYVEKQGGLPWDPNMAPEDLVRVLDPYSQAPGRNCHHGAPNQGVGGWQMVNAPPALWKELARSFEGERIPVLWCGRAPPGAPSTYRAAIVLDIPSQKDPDIHESVDAWRDQLWATSISETDLDYALGRINKILLGEGHKPIPKDIEQLK